MESKEITHCPDCKEILSLGARKCRCGWKSVESGIPAHRKYNDNHHFGTRSESMAQKVRDAINQSRNSKLSVRPKTYLEYNDAELRQFAQEAFNDMNTGDSHER